MTAKDLDNLAASLVDPIEELPHAAIEVAEVTHLALGSSMTTLCGADKFIAPFRHPSKAKRTDCLDCRNVCRLGKMPGAAANFKKGDHVEFPDGSGWLVEDLRVSGADVKCELASADHAKGRRTTISASSSLRVFTEAEWTAAIMPKPATTIVGTTGTATNASGKTKYVLTQGDVDKVMAFRALGYSYMLIEAEMGWPDMHGNRAWKIVTGKLVVK